MRRQNENEMETSLKRRKIEQSSLIDIMHGPYRF